MRMNSDAASTQLFDNLTIATTAAGSGARARTGVDWAVWLILRGDAGYEPSTPLTELMGLIRFENWKPYKAGVPVGAPACFD